MSQLSDDTIAIIEAIDRMRSEIESQLQSLKGTCDYLESGYPLSDPDGHRRFHEAIIARQKLRNEIVKDAVAHAAKAGLLSGIAFFVWLIWLYLKSEISK